MGKLIGKIEFKGQAQIFFRNLGRRGPIAPPGGADGSISSTGEVHTGLLEANSRAYCRTSARGNLLGPDP